MEKLILFGDSITAGYCEGVIDTRLNDKISGLLNAPIEIINAGIPGHTTQDALKRVENHVLRHNPTKVVLFFGANDVSKKIGIPLEKYQLNVEQLIKCIGPSRVIIVGLPYIHSVLYQDDRELTDIFQYNRLAQNIAQKHDVPFIDLLKVMMSSSDALEYLQSDGLHFSDVGYDLLAKLIVQTLNEGR